MDDGNSKMQWMMAKVRCSDHPRGKLLATHIREASYWPHTPERQAIGHTHPRGKLLATHTREASYWPHTPERHAIGHTHPRGKLLATHTLASHEQRWEPLPSSSAKFLSKNEHRAHTRTSTNQFAASYESTFQSVRHAFPLSPAVFCEHDLW
jgi:hypothetical protein